MFDFESESSRPEISRYLHGVCGSVTEGLAAYNVSLSPQETLWASTSWLLGEAEAQSTSPETIIAETSVEDAALSIVTVLLSGIAEERPGTYPFSHENTIPVPLPVAMRTMHALAIIVNLAVQNNMLRQVGYLTGAIGALARITAEQDYLRQEPYEPDSARNIDLTIDPPYCLAPQPGLAFCARIIEGAARDLSDGSMEANIDGEHVDVEQLAASLRNDAVSLRILNTAFGVNPNAPEGDAR